MPSFFFVGNEPFVQQPHNHTTSTSNTSTRNDPAYLLFKHLASKECRQDADGVFDQVRNHPGLEEPASDVLLTGLALVLALADPFLVLCQLQVQLLEVVTKKELKDS